MSAAGRPDGVSGHDHLVGVVDGLDLTQAVIRRRAEARRPLRPGSRGSCSSRSRRATLVRASLTARACARTVSPTSGVGETPATYIRYAASMRGLGSPAGGTSRASAPPRCRSSMLSSGVSASGPVRATRVSIASAGASASSMPSPSTGSGCSGSMLSCWSAGAGIVAKVSISGPSSRSGRSSSAPAGRVAEVGGLHQHEGPAAHELGELGEGRHPQDAADRGDLVGHRVGPVAPGVQHLCAALDREEQHPGIKLADRIERHLQRGHHADAAAAASDGPEQVGLVVGVGAREAAVRRSRSRPRSRCWRPARSGAPASRARRRACSRSRPRSASCPLSAARPCSPAGTVTSCHCAPASARAVWVAALMSTRRMRDVLSSIAPSSGSSGTAPWPGALRCDAHPLRAGKPDRLDDVGSGLGEDDGSRPLVGGEIPRSARLVVAAVAWYEDVTGDGLLASPDCGRW